MALQRRDESASFSVASLRSFEGTAGALCLLTDAIAPPVSVQRALAIGRDDSGLSVIVSTLTLDAGGVRPGSRRADLLDWTVAQPRLHYLMRD